MNTSNVAPFGISMSSVFVLALPSGFVIIHVVVEKGGRGLSINLTG